jgi:hypothetical protein
MAPTDRRKRVDQGIWAYLDPSRSDDRRCLRRTGEKKAGRAPHAVATTSGQGRAWAPGRTNQGEAPARRVVPRGAVIGTLDALPKCTTRRSHREPFVAPPLDEHRENQA